MEGFTIRGVDSILPGCGGASTSSRGATLAARWLHEPQPISNQPVGLGFPHRPKRYRPGGGYNVRSLIDPAGATPCGAVSTRGISVFVPGLLVL